MLDITITYYPKVGGKESPISLSHTLSTEAIVNANADLVGDMAHRLLRTLRQNSPELNAALAERNL